MRRRLPIRLLALLLSAWLLPSAAPPRAQEPEGGYEAGLRALDDGRPQDALAIWTALADQGDSAAIYGLGRLYEIGGPGFEPDKAKAAEWYRKAAGAGVVAAQNNLALLLARGEGVARDLATAAGLWEQAAVRGHPTAQYNLGLLMLRGEGVARDEAAGAAWVRKAADAGVPAAQFVMGDLRRYGIGMSQDPGRALAWYRRAAAGGYEPARAEAKRLAESGVLARGEGADAPATPDGSETAQASPAELPAAASGMAAAEAPPGDAPAPPPPPAESAAARQSVRHAALPRPSPPSPQLALPEPEAGAAAGTAAFFLRDLGEAPEARPVAAAGGPAEIEPAPRAAPAPSPPKPAELQRAALPRSGPDRAAPAAEPGGSGRYALWLGSAGDREAAERLGGRLAARHRTLLDAQQEPVVALRRVEVEGLGALYRILAGDWPERAAAEAACARLRSADPALFCSVVAL